MRWPMMILGACLAASVACCAPQAAEPTPTAESQAANVHPVSGLEVIPLTVSQDGKVHRFRVEVARTDAQQAMGLMFRTEMGPDEGMLFPSERPQARSFWMKNTVIPLDLIFVGPDGLITNIAANAVPYSLEPIPSAGAAIAVLELKGGRAAELGIRPGARVTW
jgi:uncharacterized membrane protein (UPF0127 family)